MRIIDLAHSNWNLFEEISSFKIGYICLYFTRVNYWTHAYELCQDYCSIFSRRLREKKSFVSTGVRTNNLLTRVVLLLLIWFSVSLFLNRALISTASHSTGATSRAARFDALHDQGLSWNQAEQGVGLGDDLRLRLPGPLQSQPERNLERAQGHLQRSRYLLSSSSWTQ